MNVKFAAANVALFLLFPALIFGMKTQQRAELARSSCRAVYDRATSAARVLSVVGVSRRTKLGASSRISVYSSISSELDNTPHVAIDAMQLFCDARNLDRVGDDAAAMESQASAAKKYSDPADIKLRDLKQKLDALPAVKQAEPGR